MCGVLLIAACGPNVSTPRPAPATEDEAATEPAGATPEDEAVSQPAEDEAASLAAPAHTAAPSIEVDGRVESDFVSCTLHARAGGVVAECTQGELACTEVLRADFMELPGDEVVIRCNDADAEAGGRALAMVSGDRLLWVRQLDEIYVPGRWACAWPPDSHVSVVRNDGRAWLMVQTRECGDGAATMEDADQLYGWGPNGMVAVAGIAADCNYTGDTGDPDAPEPPEDESYRCSGGYLEIVDGTVTTISVSEPVLTSAARRDGRIVLGASEVRQVLEWDPDAFRFQTPTPQTQ